MDDRIFAEDFSKMNIYFGFRPQKPWGGAPK